MSDIIDAAFQGDSTAIKQLIFASDQDEIEMALTWAAKFGHLQCVQTLIDHGTPQADAINLAAEGGHIDVVNLLLPFFKKDELLKTIDFAIRGRRIDVIHMILPLVDLSDNGSCLISAFMVGQDEIIELLYPISNPNKALEHIIELDFPDIFIEAMSMLMAEEERKIISKNIITTQNTRTKKM